jgi:hypothetical protein
LNFWSMLTASRLVYATLSSLTHPRPPNIDTNHYMAMLARLELGAAMKSWTMKTSKRTYLESAINSQMMATRLRSVHKRHL